MPQNLNYLEAATLTCAGLTAWNALYGLKQLVPGDWVLTQGTGGVSLFAVQFAKAAGAKVIATTSTREKEQILKKLGADVVINYKENPNWGEAAKKATTDGQGVAHVVEVGGPQTMAQSIKAVRIDGIITIIGFVAKGNEPQPSFIDTLAAGCTTRGLLVGSRDQFEAMECKLQQGRWMRTNKIYRTVLLLLTIFTQLLTRRFSLWVMLRRKLPSRSSHTVESDIETGRTITSGQESMSERFASRSNRYSKCSRNLSRFQFTSQFLKTLDKVT